MGTEEKIARRRSDLAALGVVVLVLGACATAPSARTASVAPPNTDGAPGSSQADHVPLHTAHELLVDVTSCWLGGLWSDARGGTADDRATASRKRCMDVTTTTFGSPDASRDEQLRALEPAAVGEVRAKILGTASKDPSDAPRERAVGALYDATADAMREAMAARRAAHRVRRDLETEPEKLRGDEVAALGDLESSEALGRLASLDVGGLSAEAHAIALIVAMDRARMARDLPVHLKTFASSGAYRVAFGVKPPALPHDATSPLPRGAWLAYLTDVARAAGHPTQPSRETPIRDRELALAGIMQGFADRLERDAPGIETDTAFARVVQEVILRLRADARGVSDAGSL